jgi:phage FluMu protein gp41
MTVQTLKIGRREFVLLPKRDFERIAAQAHRQDEQDAGDVAESRRRMKEPGGSTLAQVRKRLR